MKAIDVIQDSKEHGLHSAEDTLQMLELSAISLTIRAGYACSHLPSKADTVEMLERSVRGPIAEGRQSFVSFEDNFENR
jgi:hypothetical protein